MPSNVEVDDRCQSSCDKDNPDICRQMLK